MAQPWPASRASSLALDLHLLHGSARLVRFVLNAQVLLREVFPGSNAFSTAKSLGPYAVLGIELNERLAMLRPRGLDALHVLLAHFDGQRHHPEHWARLASTRPTEGLSQHSYSTPTYYLLTLLLLLLLLLMLLLLAGWLTGWSQRARQLGSSQPATQFRSILISLNLFKLINLLNSLTLPGWLPGCLAGWL